MFYVYLRLTCS